MPRMLCRYSELAKVSVYFAIIVSRVQFPSDSIDKRYFLGSPHCEPPMERTLRGYGVASEYRKRMSPGRHSSPGPVNCLLVFRLSASCRLRAAEDDEGVCRLHALA